MTTVTTKTKAWLSQYDRTTPQELAEGKVASLYYTGSDMAAQGWTLVGEADVTLHIAEPREMVANKIKSLRAEASAVRARATAEVTRIEGQINDLLALSFDDKAGAA